ncbi:hypothetical protein [Staphylococcus edaphicus]|nr:hypothetical protein [Staphylococcus edaphicus]
MVSTNHNFIPQPPKKNGGKIIMIIITILVFLLLVAGLIFGAYKLFFENMNISFNQNNNSQSNTSSNSSGSGDAPSIDILTESFNTSFMNQDNRQGYEGVEIGMSKDDVKNQLGSADGNLSIVGVTAEKHGNIAVHYDNDKVDRYFVVPNSDITIQQFTSQHGEPTMKAAEGGVVYDDNANNSFTIKVYADENANVTGVENVDAIERNGGSASNHEGHSGNKEPVISSSRAEEIGKEYLDKRYDDYWFHSVDKANGIYRVNYGKGNASHAHAAIYIDEDTGDISEVDPNAE